MKTQRTVDLTKVQWADYWWINGKGDTRKCCPRFDTVNGTEFIISAAAFPYDLRYPHETTLERAIRLDILDKWVPVCQLNISANRTLLYTGEKATKIWKAYNAHIYKKK